MALSNAVAEKRNEFHEKSKNLAAVMELAQDGERFNLGKKDVLEKLGATSREDALDKVKALNREIDEISVELEQAEAREVGDALKDREKARDTPVRGTGFVHPDNSPAELKTVGQLFTKSKQYESFRQERQVGQTASIDVGLKTLFQTGAGFAPESARSGLVVDAPSFSLTEITDLIPVFSLAGPAFVFMRETVRTHGAAEGAEGVAYAESTFVFEEVTNPARKIGDSIPVTDEQLEDEGSVASMLDQRLRFGVRRRLGSQILAGDGVGSNLLGILNTPDIQTQAKGGDATMAAAFKALTKVRFTGEADPTAFVFHPNDWQDIVLSQETTGPFIWGHPALVPLTRLWGLPVAVSNGITENTGLTGDFRNFSRLDEKRGVDVQIGFVNNQFMEGKKTLRADIRVAFSVTRGAAFAEITGI
jgi:HK97 family phage major capsid protein